MSETPSDRKGSGNDIDAPVGPPVSQQTSRPGLKAEDLASRDKELEEKLRAAYKQPRMIEPSVSAESIAGSSTGSEEAPIHQPISQQASGVRLTKENLERHNKQQKQQQEEEEKNQSLAAAGALAPTVAPTGSNSSALSVGADEGENVEPDEDELDDHLSVGATPAAIHAPAAPNEPNNFSQLVLPSGHVLDIVTNNGQKSIIIPNTNNLSNPQIRELARGLVAAAIAEGAYTTNADGSYHFKIDAKDFRLRAALEAQIDTLGHTYNKANPNLVAQEKQQINNAFLLKANYYDELIASIKKATVEDNINYCKDADGKRAELTGYQDSLVNLRNPDLTVKKLLKKNISDSKKDLQTITEPEYDQNGRLTENSRQKAKEGFYRKYLGGVHGEGKVAQSITEARAEHLGQKARWFGDDKAYREFKKNFKLYHADKLFTDPQTDLSNLAPEQRMQKIFEQVIEGGIYRKTSAERKTILEHIDKKDYPSAAKVAREFGQQRAELAAKTTPGNTRPNIR